MLILPSAAEFHSIDADHLAFDSESITDEMVSGLFGRFECAKEFVAKLSSS
jgi:hypothetical protein